MWPLKDFKAVSVTWASGACQLLLTLISRQAGRTKRPSWFNVAESDLCVCLLCKFMQNRLMLKCCISTRDTEIQIQPILSELFPESKAQSGTIPTKNATPTWARSPGSVGNLRSMGIDWFHQESLYGSGSKRNFFMLPTVLGVRSCYSPPGQQGCLAVAARQQRWAHMGCQRFYKGQKGGWGGRDGEGWRALRCIHTLNTPQCAPPSA